MADRDFLVKNGLVVASGNLSITDKIVHSGDSDTAVRFPAANTVTVETNGSERMRVDSSGNVGIGKSPATKLDVNGTVTATAFSGNATTASTLQTARTIAISGDVTGSATSFDGGSNITISAGITAGSIVSADFSSAASLIIYNSAGTALKTIYSPGS